MKPEDKDLKQSVELSEEELDGVAGGQQGPFPGAAFTMQYQSGMKMGARTMEYKPGENPVQPQTVGQQCAVHPTSREEINKL